MPYVARVLRGAALKERGQPYVAALEVQGASGTSICLRHIVPNILPLIVAQATILFGWAMVDLAAISFLGLGVQPPAPNWGVMISENQPGILQGYPLPALAAGLCIVGVVIAFNVLGERLFERGPGGAPVTGPARRQTRPRRARRAPGRQAAAAAVGREPHRAAAGRRSSSGRCCETSACRSAPARRSAWSASRARASR